MARTLGATLAILGTACGDRAGQQESPRAGGTAVIVATAGLDAFNPLVTNSAYTQQVNRHLLFMPLLRFDVNLGLEPWLAESWTMEGDSAALFHLRSDVRWQDGVATTAYDAAFTFRRAMDPETGYPNISYFAHWTGVEVLDSLTLRVAYEPHPEPLAGVPLLPVLPAHALDSVPAAEMRTAAFNRRPLANGPFLLVDARAGERWVFQANTRFPSDLGGPPLLDRIVWRMVPEPQAQVAELITGNAHMAMEPPADRFDSLAARPDLAGIERPSFRYTFIGWNGRRPPLDSPVMRRALTRAIDRKAILQATRNGHGALAIGPVPPAHWAFATDIEPLTYAPDAARDTLALLGFQQRDDDPTLESPDGRELRFQLLIPAGNDATRNLAQMIQADLHDVGVSLDLRPLDFGTLVQTITAPQRDFDAVLLALDADVRLDLAALFHSRARAGPFQIAGYANPRVDSLLDTVAASFDRHRARQLWAEIQAALVRDQPWTFLYYYPDLILIRENLHGVRMDLRGAFRSAPEWWLMAPDPARGPVPKRDTPATVVSDRDTAQSP